MFEVNLPNHVTKIMVVPLQGTVVDAVKPMIIKHHYRLDILELRYAHNLKVSSMLLFLFSYIEHGRAWNQDELTLN